MAASKFGAIMNTVPVQRITQIFVCALFQLFCVDPKEHSHCGKGVLGFCKELSSVRQEEMAQWLRVHIPAEDLRSFASSHRVISHSPVTAGLEYLKLFCDI